MTNEQSKYCDEDKLAAYNTALEAANEVAGHKNDDPAKTADEYQETIDNAAQALRNAYTALVNSVDTDRFSDALDDLTEDIARDGADQDKLDAFDDAVEAAEAVINDENSTREEIEDALDAVEAAKDAITYSVDTSALEDAMSIARDKLAKDYYTTTSYQNLQSKYNDAVAALAAAATNAPREEYLSSKSTVDAATRALNNAINALVIANGNYSAYNAALSKLNALIRNPNITTAAKNAIQEGIREAGAVAYDNGRAYKADNQAKIDQGTAMLNALLAEYTNPDGTLKDEYKKKYDMSTAESKIANAENVKDQYIPESAQAIDDAINAIKDYAAENGITWNDDGTFTNNTVAADNAMFDAGLNALIRALDDAIRNGTKKPADYTEYDEVYAILETLRDNDVITDALHTQINNKLDNPLPRDLTADKQSRVDKETQAIKDILDKILEKDGEGHYTDVIRDEAKIHYTVIFKWLGKSQTVSVVKGGDAVAPEIDPIIGVDGKTEGHYIFTGWDREFTNVTGNIVVNGLFDVEQHTDEDKNNYCEVCGAKIDTSFKCKMCPTYEKYKDVPVIGIFFRIIHFFVHLAHSIGYRT